MQRKFVDGRMERRTAEPASEDVGSQHRRFVDNHNFNGKDRERLPAISKVEDAAINHVDAIAKPPIAAFMNQSNRLMLVDVPRRSEVEERLAVMQKEPFRPTPTQRNRSNPLLGPVSDGKLRPDGPFVCYRHAMKGTCDRGTECPFSHDDNLARRWVQSKAKMYAESPHLKHSDIQMSLIDEDADLGQMYRFTAAEESDEEEEDARMFSFRGEPETTGCLDLRNKLIASTPYPKRLVPTPPKLGTLPRLGGSDSRPTGGARIVPGRG